MSTATAHVPSSTATRPTLSPEEGAIVGLHNTHGMAAIHSGLLHRKTEVLVCVVDHDNSVRKAVTRLLKSEKYPIESFVSVQSFLNRKAHAGPCCLVLNVHMPGLSGVHLLQILSKDWRTEQIIFMSGQGDIRMCAQALKAGAVDFLTKPWKDSELLEAVKTALLRSEHLLCLRTEKQAAQALLHELTPREREVLSFVIAGKINKEIAAELGTTEKTIKKHRGSLMKKLKVGSIAELVHFSLRCGVKPACPYGTKVPYTGMR